MKNKKPLIVDWKVDGGKIVFFEADGRALAQMDGERFGLLLNGDYVKGQLAEAAQDRLWPSEWELEKFVEAGRLLKKLLSLEQIAGLWGAPDAAVRSFYGAGLQKFGRDRGLTEAAAARQGSSKTEKDYCLSLRPANTRASEEPRAGEDFLEIPRMAAILKEQGPGGTAVKMELDFADLQDWIEKNKRYLTLFGYKDNLF